MSATEIIEQIQRLPKDEQQKVAEFMRQLEAQAKPPRSGEEVSGEFKRIADEMFTTNAELFRKLAQ